MQSIISRKRDKGSAQPTRATPGVSPSSIYVYTSIDTLPGTFLLAATAVACVVIAAMIKTANNDHHNGRSEGEMGWQVNLLRSQPQSSWLMKTVQAVLQRAGVDMAALLERQEVISACQQYLDRLPRPLGMTLHLLALLHLTRVYAVLGASCCRSCHRSFAVQLAPLWSVLHVSACLCAADECDVNLMLLYGSLSKLMETG